MEIEMEFMALEYAVSFPLPSNFRESSFCGQEWTDGKSSGGQNGWTPS